MSLSGLIVIDKPAEWTSNDVVQKVKGILRARKVGHTGTLDPAATGILVLCINEATCQAARITDHSKGYEAVVLLGSATDTGDREGKVTETGPVPVLTESQIHKVLHEFEGEIEQTVPLYSAVRVKGKKLYQWAREGKGADIIRPRRRVMIDSIELSSWQDNRLDLHVSCSKGTYIRVLAEDIGKALGVPAHLGALRRVRLGPYVLEQAITIDELEKALSAGESPLSPAWLLPCP